MRDSLLKHGARIGALLALLVAGFYLGTREAPVEAPIPRTPAPQPSDAEQAPAATPLAGAAPAPRAAVEDVARDVRAAGPTDDAEERRLAAEIVELVRLGQVGHARALTDRFYRTFPNSAEIPNLERLTGYHPRPYGPTPSH